MSQTKARVVHNAEKFIKRLLPAPAFGENKQIVIKYCALKS